AVPLRRAPRRAARHSLRVAARAQRARRTRGRRAARRPPGGLVAPPAAQRARRRARNLYGLMALRLITAGESHGPGLTCIVEGLPAGLELDRDAINGDMARRQLGHGRGGRMKIERDRADVTAGVRHGKTLGGPVALQIPNRDFSNWEERMNPWPVEAEV